MAKKIQSNLDLPDSDNDKQHLKQEKATLDLPDVEDIPGQENIKVPRLGEFADSTASSADEEGDDIFNDPEQDGDPSDVTAAERVLLSRSANQTPGEESEMDARGASLDRKDNEGEILNEGDLATDRFGEDLDLPSSEEVDEEE